MLRKCLALALLAICAAPMYADVLLETSISDVFNRGSNELAGSITMTVDDDDFKDASTEDPIYIRVTPDHNSALAETLVEQTNATFIGRPINLAMEIKGLISGRECRALPETVQIVRWVEGESAFWIRVQTSSDTWIGAAGGAGGSFGPDQDIQVSWVMGITARQSDAIYDSSNGTSNLPFNTRENDAGQTDPGEGDWDRATSTLLCVDLTGSNLLADGTFESLLRFDIISFTDTADQGNGVYVGNEGGADFAGVSFDGTRDIARGKSRACTVTAGEIPKFGLPFARLCIFQAEVNGSANEWIDLCNTLTFTINCSSGGNFLTTQFFAGSYVEFSTPGNQVYGFADYEDGLSAATVSFDNNFGSGDFVGFSTFIGSSEFTNNGRDLYRTARLYYDGDTRSAASLTLYIQVCVTMHYTEDPTTAEADYDVVLVNHRGAIDNVANGSIDDRYDGIGSASDGSDQWRRCQPSEFLIGSGNFVIGDYIPCAGQPAVIFFPYVPKLVGSSFWVGLSYTNQGGVDLAVETIFYAENGDRFVGDMPSLPTKNQMTWVLANDADTGVTGLTGAGDNNNGDLVVPAPSDPTVPADSFGTTRSSMFVRGTFEPEFLDFVFAGDLDGYLLIGDAVSGSVDGAYLPRNYDNDIPGQNADLPLSRSKRALNTVKSLPIEGDSESTFDRHVRFQ